MSRPKNPKTSDSRGFISAAIGPQLKQELYSVARQENRSANRQVAVIIREWIEQRKAHDTTATGAGA